MKSLQRTVWEVRSMQDKTDFMAQITAAASKAIDALLLRSPVKTAFGVLIGIVGKGLLDIVFKLNELELEVSHVFCIAAGLLLVHFPSLFFRHNYDEGIETAIHYVREIQKNGNFTEAEKRRQWRMLIERAYEKINEEEPQVEKEKKPDTPTPAT